MVNHVLIVNHDNISLNVVVVPAQIEILAGEELDFFQRGKRVLQVYSSWGSGSQNKLPAAGTQSMGRSSAVAAS